MVNHSATPQRLYLMQVASGLTPVVCYLIQTTGGKNILIDSGLPKDFQPPSEMGLPPISYAQDVVEQLALLDLYPGNIDMLICTHFDIDHCGNHPAFAQAQLVVQRQHYELAHSGYPCFDRWRSRWADPALRYQQLDSDCELFPGIELIVTNGHVRGHQSVLVCLPETGPVLLTIDAVPTVFPFMLPLLLSAVRQCDCFDALILVPHLLFCVFGDQKIKRGMTVADLNPLQKEALVTIQETNEIWGWGNMAFFVGKFFDPQYSGLTSIWDREDIGAFLAGEKVFQERSW